MPTFPPQVHPSDLHGMLTIVDMPPLPVADAIPTLLSHEAQQALLRWINEQNPESIPNTRLEKGALPGLDWPVIFDNQGNYYAMYYVHSDRTQYAMLKTDEEKAFFLSSRNCRSMDELSTQSKGLGRGAFGEVTLCQRQDGLWMACKSLSVVDYEEEVDSVERIKNEYKIGIKVNPNTAISESIETSQWGAGWVNEVDDGALGLYEEKTLNIHLFIPFLNGMTLKQFVKKEKETEPIHDQLPFHELEALKIVVKVLEKLSVLHERSILHRDIKLENIMLLEHGVEIFDFGLAVDLADANQQSFLEESVGTPEYEAPELYATEHQKVPIYSEKSDIFALGRVGVLLLAAEAASIRDDPFSPIPPDPSKAGCGSILQYRNANLQEKMNRFFQENKLIFNDEILSFFLKMLSPEPADRPSAQEALAIGKALLERICDDSRPDSGIGPDDDPNQPKKPKLGL